MLSIQLFYKPPSFIRSAACINQIFWEYLCGPLVCKPHSKPVYKEKNKYSLICAYVLKTFAQTRLTFFRLCICVFCAENFSAFIIYRLPFWVPRVRRRLQQPLRFFRF